MANGTFYTKEAIIERIAQIQSGTAKNFGQGETAPDGRLFSEVNAALYSEISFLEEVLRQSIISFPIEVPIKGQF